MIVTCGKSHLNFWTMEGKTLTKRQGLFEVNLNRGDIIRELHTFMSVQSIILQMKMFMIGYLKILILFSLCTEKWKAKVCSVPNLCGERRCHHWGLQWEYLHLGKRLGKKANSWFGDTGFAQSKLLEQCANRSEPLTVKKNLIFSRVLPLHVSKLHP